MKKYKPYFPLLRWAAKRLSKLTGCNVSGIEFDGRRFHFSIQRYSAMKIIGLNGETEREAFISDTWVKSSLPVWTEMACYPYQLLNGDAVFFIKKNLTQNEHERFTL